MDTEVRTLPVGASAWETDLHALLSEHVVTERAMLEEYVDAAASSGSTALEYIVGLLVDDERRHHRMWMDLADSLCADAELVGEEPSVPYLDFDRSNADQVIEITERLLRNERDDVRQLKRVRSMLRSVEDTTLWGLLVELMEHDTRKHIAILRYASRQAAIARRR